MSIARTRLPIALVLGASLVPLVWGCKATTPEEQQDEALATPVSVRAVRAESTTLRPTVDLVGTLVALPERTTAVSPQVAGWIRRVAVVEGARARAGDELVRLDARLVEADLAKAAASVAEKEATLARLRRGYLPQEIEMARAELTKCREGAKALRAEAAALKPLKEKNEVPDLQWQKVQAAVDSADAGCRAADAKLRMLEAGTPREEMVEAGSRLAVAKAELAAAKLTVDLCRITSPIDGTILQLGARQGMFVERAATLLTIADVSRMFVQVRIPSSDLANLRMGARADVWVSSQPDRALPGKVERTSGQADAATGAVDAFVVISNEKGDFQPGLTCRVRLYLPEVPGVVAVPVAAVADHAGTPVITVVRQDRAHEIKVKLGMRTLEHVQVLEGISPGEWVVTEGGYGLPDDCPVTIVQEPPQNEAARASH